MLAGLNKNRILQTISQIKGMGNPAMMLQQMPQYKQVMDYVNANGGDPQAEMLSLKRLCSLEGDYEVYPGHMDSTTLERERRFNPFMLDAMEDQD